jgi:hypothetical protein
VAALLGARRSPDVAMQQARAPVTLGFENGTRGGSGIVTMPPERMGTALGNCGFLDVSTILSKDRVY